MLVTGLRPSRFTNKARLLIAHIKGVAVKKEHLKAVAVISAMVAAIGYFVLFVMHDPRTGNLRADPSWHASEFYAINAIVKAVGDLPPQSRNLDELRARQDVGQFMTDTRRVSLSERPGSIASILELDGSRLVISVSNVDGGSCSSYLLYGIQGGELAALHGEVWVAVASKSAAEKVFKSGDYPKNGLGLSIDQAIMACPRDVDILITFNFDSPKAR
jgi:hypothetical protein